MTLRINFVLPSILKAGGVLVVLEYAARLNKLGHDVAVYYPLLPYGGFIGAGQSPLGKFLSGRLRPFLGNLVRFRRSLPWISEPVRVRPIPWVHPAFIRKADAVVATAWPTAYSVAAFPAELGAKYYFIQHYETWDSDPAEVDGSYRLPLTLITIAPWLTDLMSEKFGRKIAAEIHNGLDLDVFRPGPPRDWSSPILLMLYHEAEWKGSKKGLEVLRRIAGKFPAVRLMLFGMGKRPEGSDFTYHQNPSMGKLPELYRSACIFLSPSLTEGWGLPVMEAMASGCAVVATRTGCVPVIDEGDNILAVEPGDYGSMESHLEFLLRNPGEAIALAARGSETARAFGWDAPVRKMESVLMGVKA